MKIHYMVINATNGACCSRHDSRRSRKPRNSILVEANTGRNLLKQFPIIMRAIKKARSCSRRCKSKWKADVC